jgi:Smr domain
MRKAHREAAKALYEERNHHLTTHSANNDEEGEEFYIDLHGLHPEEAVEYLEGVLSSNSSRLGSGRGSRKSKIVYAITGTGHHSKNGKDKVGKAVRSWLGEGGYTYREFSVPGERGGYVGGVLGIDASTGLRRHVGAEDKGDATASAPVPVGVGGKIQVLKREETTS